MCHRTFASLVPAILTLVIFTAATTEAQPTSAMSRTRTSDAIIRQMIARGCASSPSFRRLIEAIEGSDIIVYVERQSLRSQGLVGMTRFVIHAGSVRYVRVGIDSALLGAQAIAILGHELQHVLEIAEAPWVIDRATVETLFRSIGHQASGERQRYDTNDAVTFGRLVWQELHTHSRTDKRERAGQ